MSLRHLVPTIGCALAATVTGCSPDVDHLSTNRGTTSDSQSTTVENAFIVPASPPRSCGQQIGDTAHLRFTVTNNRPAERERLTAVHTDAADVALAGAATAEIPAGAALAVGQPHAGDAIAAPPARLTGLDDRVGPGMSVPVTFTFAEYGPLTLQVPIEACPTQQR